MKEHGAGGGGGGVGRGGSQQAAVVGVNVLGHGREGAGAGDHVVRDLGERVEARENFHRVLLLFKEK